MIAITYTIALRGPVLATMLAGDPNSSVSYSFIPGSMIRGMLIGRYGTTDELPISARDLFFNSKVRYLNAYPRHPEAEPPRGLPVPASWRKEKVRTTKVGAIEDWALLDEPDSDSELTDAVPLSGGFVWLEYDEAEIRTPNHQISVHTQRARKQGRATADGGAVYRYEALAEGEQFAGAILCENKALAKQVLELLIEGTTYLGGAQTAGYGQVQIDNIYPKEIDGANEQESWFEYQYNLEKIAEDDTVVITLLSDLILRDKYGATHTDLLSTLDLPLEHVRTFKQVTIIGGFNRKWGLPLPQTQALAAGSVFVCKATGAISEGEIEKLLATGVGERRAEGYGRLALNWQTEETIQQQSANSEIYELPKLEISTDTANSAHQLAQRMVNRRQRQLLDQALLKTVRELTIDRKLPNSQLSGIRIIARHALKEERLSRISNLFKEKTADGKENPNVIKRHARNKFERARVGKMRLNDWIVQLADEPESVWRKLDRPNPHLGDIEPTQELTAEYAVRLIDAVLGKAMRDEKSNVGHKEGSENGAA